MKYWKKANGDIGTMADDGFVPDSTTILKAEYDTYVSSFSGLPVKKTLKKMLLDRALISQLMYDEVL